MSTKRIRLTRWFAGIVVPLSIAISPVIGLNYAQAMGGPASSICIIVPEMCVPLEILDFKPDSTVVGQNYRPKLQVIVQGGSLYSPLKFYFYCDSKSADATSVTIMPGTLGNYAPYVNHEYETAITTSESCPYVYNGTYEVPNSPLPKVIVTRGTKKVTKTFPGIILVPGSTYVPPTSTNNPTGAGIVPSFGEGSRSW